MKKEKKRKRKKVVVVSFRLVGMLQPNHVFFEYNLAAIKQRGV